MCAWGRVCRPINSVSWRAVGSERMRILGGEQVAWGSRVTGSVSLEAVFFLSTFSVL